MNTQHSADKVIAIGTPSSRLTEAQFYNVYLMMISIKDKRYEPLTAAQRELLALIMSKPMDYTIVALAKDGKLITIAEELSTKDKKKTANSIYILMSRMKQYEYFVITEDKQIALKAHLQKVRCKVKSQIKKQGYATFDCIFKCQIA